MSDRTVFVFLNASSGTASTLGLTPAALGESFAGRGIKAEIVSPGQDGDFATLLDRARKSPAQTLVAAGGDGTVTALAEIAVETGKTLAILPLGTANLLARDLGIPLEREAWLDTFDAMEPRQIDIARVNGRVFLHKIVVGLMPGIASARERLRSRSGPLPALAFVGFIKRRIERFRRFPIDIDIDGNGPHRTRLSAVAVANNAYSEGFGRVFQRERLDTGKLAVYIARHITVADTLRLFGGMLVGNWYRADALTAIDAQTVVLDRKKRIVKAMVDGDPMTLENPLRIEATPGALSILAPKQDEKSGVSAVFDLLQSG